MCVNVCLLRLQKPEHSVLPDDDTTVAHAHVAKRSVVDQDIVLSTTVRPLSWACVLLLRALTSCGCLSALGAHLHQSGLAQSAPLSNPCATNASACAPRRLQHQYVRAHCTVSLEHRICGHERNDADKLVGSGGAVRSYVVAKPGGTTGRFEVEVVGLCPAHTPAWLKSLQVCAAAAAAAAAECMSLTAIVVVCQASGVPFADEDFHLVTRDTVLSTMQSELI